MLTISLIHESIGGLKINMGKYPIEKCPKCGGVDFYVKQRISGTANYYDTLDGSKTDNSSLHDNLSYKTTSKYATCVDCKKKLFKITDDMDLY